MTAAARVGRAVHRLAARVVLVIHATHVQLKTLAPRQPVVLPPAARLPAVAATRVQQVPVVLPPAAPAIPAIPVGQATLAPPRRVVHAERVVPVAQLWQM